MKLLLEQMIPVVKSAGKKVMDLLGNSKVEEKGSSQNLVTEADTLSEQFLSNELKKIVPEARVLGEESTGDEDLSSSKLWIIDPLDGTNNFAHSIPHFSISVAYAEAGIVKAGVVYDPVRQECFGAVVNEGAYLNDKPISVSPNKSIQDSIVATGFYYDRGILMERTLLSIHRLFKANVRGIRRIGSAALDICWVACGRFEGYFEYQLSPWDFAAAQLIVKEAGGVSCDQDGVDRGIHSKGLICSNGNIYIDLLNCVKQREEFWSV